MSSPLTTHILDTALGKPAVNVPIRVERLSDGQWTHLSAGTTNSDGRCPGLLTQTTFVKGCYRITFDTDAYFKALGSEGFYPYVQVVFNITDPGQHYHIPLLLSPYGYSTYRGS
eukprot:Colp12_sorted_trinity150504_noHs@9119